MEDSGSSNFLFEALSVLPESSQEIVQSAMHKISDHDVALYGAKIVALLDGSSVHLEGLLHLSVAVFLLCVTYLGFDRASPAESNETLEDELQNRIRIEIADGEDLAIQGTSHSDLRLPEALRNYPPKTRYRIFLAGKAAGIELGDISDINIFKRIWVYVTLLGWVRIFSGSYDKWVVTGSMLISALLLGYLVDITLFSPNVSITHDLARYFYWCFLIVALVVMLLSAAANRFSKSGIERKAKRFATGLKNATNVAKEIRAKEKIDILNGGDKNDAPGGEQSGKAPK